MRYITFFIFISFAPPLAAQTPDGVTPTPNEYDLATITQTALKEHPSLRGAQAQIAGAQAKLSEARSGNKPRLVASAGYTQLESAPSFTVSPLGTLVFGDRENPQAALSLQWPLYSGGRVAGLAQQAKAGVSAANHNLTRQRQQVARDTTTAYFHVLKARGFVGVAESQLRTLQAQRDDIAKMLERGVTTRLDLLRAETALAGAQEMLSKARNSEAVAMAALSNAMGLPVTATLKVADASATAPSNRLPGELPLSATEAVAEALRERPELRKLAAQREAAQAGFGIAASAKRPSVSAFAQLDAERPTFMPNTGHWSAGVAMSLALSDGGAASAAKAQARSQTAQIEAAQEELRNNISLQATAAWLDVQSAGERLATTEKAAASAEEGLRLARLGYSNGVNTITDFLAAQSERTRAQNDRVTALFDLNAAQSDLRFALGRSPQ